MSAILKYLLAYGSDLYETGRFRFVDSGVSPSFGGDAFLVLASDVLRLRFVSDRGQLFLDVQSVEQEGKEDWYSIDVVRRLVTGEHLSSAELDEDYAAFLRRCLDEIERRFAKGKVTETIRVLKELERERAKELFG